MFNLFRFTLLLCLACTAVDLLAAGQRRHLSTQRDSGISIEVQPYFTDIPRFGYIPTRVSIGNYSGRPREWTLTTRDTDWGNRPQETMGQFHFQVAANETRVFDILIPLSALPRSGMRSGFISLTFSGYGIPIDDAQINLHRVFHGRGSGISGPFTGFSMDLHTPNWGPLTQTPGGIFGAGINPDRLPGDWRGLSGFDVIWFTDDDWRRVSGIERRALLDWIAAGGDLVISREENDDTPIRLAGLPGETTAGDALPYGFGRVHFRTRQGMNLDHDAVSNFLLTLHPSTESLVSNRISEGNWELFNQVGLPRVPVFFFSAFLTVFAILIGPVNFLVFAKPGQRHRLLWTTPLISLVAGTLVMVLILFQDGTGGSGMRLAVWHHLPQDNRAVLLQEQAARTGLLVSSNFTLTEPVVMSQLNLNTGRTANGHRFQLAGNQYGGDWFLSRSTQSQFLQSVPATRSRIELTGNPASANGAAPALNSTLPHDIDTVYYRDQSGTLWAGGPLIPGTPLPLAPAEPSDFEDWWRAQNAKCSPVTRAFLDAQKNRMGYFFAAADGAFHGPETLGSINWEAQHSLHLGPISTDP